MSQASKIRHSVVGKVARTSIHAVYRAMNPAGRPVKYRLPGGLYIELYPEGEIAEFLMLQRFHGLGGKRPAKAPLPVFAE